MIRPKNLTEVHELLTNFGKWAQTRPEGLYRPPLSYPSVKSLNFTMTDEDGLYIDRVLSQLYSRYPYHIGILVCCYVRRLSLREIARLYDVSYTEIQRESDRAKTLVLQALIG